MTVVVSSQQDRIEIQIQSLFGSRREVVQSGDLLGGSLEHQMEGGNMGFPELYLDGLNHGVEVEEAVD